MSPIARNLLYAKTKAQFLSDLVNKTLKTGFLQEGSNVSPCIHAGRPDQNSWIPKRISVLTGPTIHFVGFVMRGLGIYDPRRKKTGLQGFQPGPTQTGL